jgi:hypothetical protein
MPRCAWEGARRWVQLSTVLACVRMRVCVCVCCSWRQHTGRQKQQQQQQQAQQRVWTRVGGSMSTPWWRAMCLGAAGYAVCFRCVCAACVCCTWHMCVCVCALGWLALSPPQAKGCGVCVSVCVCVSACGWAARPVRPVPLTCAPFSSVSVLCTAVASTLCVCVFFAGLCLLVTAACACAQLCWRLRGAGCMWRTRTAQPCTAPTHMCAVG